jgi:hypothetical protein
VPDSVERNNPERGHSGVIVPETADATLLDQPLRGLADVEAIERIPLESRLKIVDISQRVALGLAARGPDETAIFYVPDGDVDRPAVEVPFSELRRNIGRSASLLRARGIGRYDVVAVLLPAVPTIYWSIIGAMAAGIVFPVNWMLEPRHVLHLIKEANAKAVIALGPTPGFKIWESLMSIAGDQAPAYRPSDEQARHVLRQGGSRYRHLPAFRRDDRIAEDRADFASQCVVQALDIAARLQGRRRRGHLSRHADVSFRRAHGSLHPALGERRQRTHPQRHGSA